MVIVHLKGGLGNQLFQYAYGKALMETGVEVIFDTSFFYKENSYTKRLLSLDKFNIPSETHFRNVESKQIYWKRILNKIDSDRRVRFVKMEKYKKSGVADGDYVSEKYFSTIRKKLLQEITLKEESPLFLKYKKQILESKNPTIVHARRTDYLASTGFTQLSVEYYKDGRMMIEDQATLFCFSDDPDWVKTLFPSEEVVIVSGNGLTDYEELMLMSYGKNFIIANSTFSWWGAWLAQHPNKKVIAPKKWFTRKLWWRANRDVVPEGWIRV